MTNEYMMMRGGGERDEMIMDYEDQFPATISGTSSAMSSLVTSRPGTPPPLEIPPADGTPKGDFVHELYSFMMKISQPITKVPHLGYQELDLYRLYQLVTERGGMDAVTKRQEWKVVYQELGIPTMSTSASYNTRTNYKKYIYLYELEHCNFDDPDRPKDAQPLFSTNDHVRIVSENYDGRVFYAKVVKSRWTDGEFKYYVHYNGWSTSHDEWMPERVLSALLPAEKVRPDRLTNPQPNRSSKSNHIIGDPGPPANSSGATTPREKKKRKGSGKAIKKERKNQLESDYSESDSSSSSSFVLKNNFTDSPTEVHHQHSKISSSSASKRSLRVRKVATGNNSNEDNSNEKGMNKLRLRLRHRPDQFSSSTTAPPFFPSIKIIQSELEWLEAEMFLHYTPPANPHFITSRNMHGQSLGRATDGMILNNKLVDSVDLRVPNLEDILGPPPKITASSKKIDSDSVVTAPKSEGAPPSNENIKGIIRELKIIKREYQARKKLLKLYYGSSSSNSESGSSGSSPNLVPVQRPSRTTRRRK